MERKTWPDARRAQTPGITDAKGKGRKERKCAQAGKASSKDRNEQKLDLPQRSLAPVAHHKNAQKRDLQHTDKEPRNNSAKGSKFHERSHKSRHNTDVPKLFIAYATLVVQNVGNACKRANYKKSRYKIIKFVSPKSMIVKLTLYNPYHPLNITNLSQ